MFTSILKSSETSKKLAQGLRIIYPYAVKKVNLFQNGIEHIWDALFSTLKDRNKSHPNQDSGFFFLPVQGFL